MDVILKAKFIKQYMWVITKLGNISTVALAFVLEIYLEKRECLADIGSVTW